MGEYRKKYKLQLRQSFQVCLLVLVGICFSTASIAQALVNKKMSGNYFNTKLIDVLHDIEMKGDLYFSFNGQSFPKDSLINLSINDQSISNILTTLFEGRFEFEVSKRYVIVTPFKPEMTLQNLDITNDNKYASVSGVVVNSVSGERLMNASIYNKRQLVSTLSDRHGYFKIKIQPTDSLLVNLTVSKANYKDADLNFLQTVNVSSRMNFNSSAKSKRHNGVETISLGKMLTTTRQRIQSMNIPDFFASRPVQASITPGLSTQGMLSTQVVNKASLNLLGGYTAGVNGVEIGGLFNVNRLDAKYFQVAGIFNLVGGNFTGLQTAGVYNLALDTVRGVQIAGFINKAESNLMGIQLSMLHNEAKKITGLQIGFVNSADTARGASIGLINIIRNGFYKISLTSNNIVATNLSFKSGTHAFYNNLRVGSDFSGNQRMFYLGIGAGHDFLFNKNFYLSSEADFNFVNRGHWGDRWVSGRLLFNYQIGRSLSLLAGPTFNSYKEARREQKVDYTDVTYNPVYDQNSRFRSNAKNVLGWEAGLSYNSTFRKSLNKTVDNSSSWFLGVGFNGGIMLNKPYKNSYGTDFFLSRDLGNNLSAVASIGFTHISPYKNYIEYSDESNSYYYNRIEATAYNIIPIKVGVRSGLSDIFYIGGDIGHAWANHNFGLISVIEGKETRISYPSRQTIKSMMFSAVAGFKFRNGFDLGAKYEHFLAFPKVQQLGLRVAYQIKLNN